MSIGLKSGKLLSEKMASKFVGLHVETAYNNSEKPSSLTIVTLAGKVDCG